MSSQATLFLNKELCDIYIIIKSGKFIYTFKFLGKKLGQWWEIDQK
jgi:hypothetical protein